ncbi:hypothetical protein ACFWPV_09965 [Streptomyces uncialis]|uniref:hypothetical protein n=1 Tax=Streptomyces uncialis TaxID=1048205 RepID=UPI00366973C7
MSTTPDPRAERRTRVAQLDAEGLSTRAIAAKLGIGKDTVRRDLAALRRDAPTGAPADAPPPAPGAPGASGAAPDPAPPPHPGPRDAPPCCASGILAALDARAQADIATIRLTGGTVEDAISDAVLVLANAYRGAWRFGLYPYGVAPDVKYVELRPYTGRPGAGRLYRPPRRSAGPPREDHPHDR